MANSPSLSPEDTRLLGAIKLSLDGFRDGIADDLRKSQDASLLEHEATRKHVDKMVTHLRTVTHMVKKMWKDNYGSDPPPDDPPGEAVDMPSLVEIDDAAAGQPRPTPIDEKLSDHDSTLEALHTKVGHAETLATEANGKIDQLLSLQKEQMGKRDPKDERSFLRRFGDGLLWLMRERAGHKFALAMITTITTLVTACGMSYALMTGRLPPPTTYTTPSRSLVP